jgi:hypothetical protein
MRGFSLGFPGLVRMSKGRLLLWDTVSEQVLLDFGANVRDKWLFRLRYETFDFIYDIELVSKMTQVSTPAGTFKGCYRFDVKAINAIDADGILVVSPYVGVVMRRTGFGVSYFLQDFRLTE